MSRGAKAVVGPGLAAALLIALALVPLSTFETRSYAISLLTLFFIYGVLSQSYDIMGGTLGYVNLGHVVFFGVGAYAFGILYNVGSGLVLGLAGGLAAGALFALAIGYPFFRLRGAYFSLASFGLVELVQHITINLGWLTGGSNGLKIAAADRTVETYYLTLGLLAIAIAASWIISRSRLGLAMKSIREDESVARDFGVPTTRVKIQALVISSAFPAVLGGLYTWSFNFIDPGEVFGLRIALQPVAMAMLGGTGLVIGPLLGTAFLFATEELIWTKFEYLHGAMLGLVIVLVGLFMPGGLARLVPVRALRERFGLLEEDQ